MSLEASEPRTQNRAWREWLPVIGTGFVAVIVLAGFVGFLDVLKNAPEEPPPEDLVQESVAQDPVKAVPPDSSGGMSSTEEGGTPGVTPLAEGDPALSGGGTPSGGTVAAGGSVNDPPDANVTPPDPEPTRVPRDSFGGESIAYTANVATVAAHTREVVAHRAEIARIVLAGAIPPESAAALVHADALQVNATRHLLSTMTPPASERTRHATILAAHDTILQAYGALERCVASGGVIECPESVLAFDTGTRALNTAVGFADTP